MPVRNPKSTGHTLWPMGASAKLWTVSNLPKVLFALAVAFVLSACGSDRNAAPADEIGDANDEPAVVDVAASGVRTSPEISEPVARPDIEVVDESIVRIIGFGCGAPALGSGFAVSENLVVTSGHVVTGRDPESLAVLRSSGEEFAATLVGFDLDLDLAVLRVDGIVLDPVNLITDVPVVDGVVVGIRSEAGEPFINEVDFTVDAPVNVNWDGVFRDTESRFRGVRIDATIRPGDSGSGLFVNDHDVIGLIHSRNRNGIPRAYAVGSVEIADFVDSIDPEMEIVADRCA